MPLAEGNVCNGAEPVPEKMLCESYTLTGPFVNATSNL